MLEKGVKKMKRGAAKPRFWGFAGEGFGGYDWKRSERGTAKCLRFKEDRFLVRAIKVSICASMAVF